MSRLNSAVSNVTTVDAELDLEQAMGESSGARWPESRSAVSLAIVGADDVAVCFGLKGDDTFVSSVERLTESGSMVSFAVVGVEVFACFGSGVDDTFVSSVESGSAVSFAMVGAEVFACFGSGGDDTFISSVRRLPEARLQ